MDKQTYEKVRTWEVEEHCTKCERAWSDWRAGEISAAERDLRIRIAWERWMQFQALEVPK